MSGPKLMICFVLLHLASVPMMVADVTTKGGHHGWKLAGLITANCGILCGIFGLGKMYTMPEPPPYRRRHKYYY